MRARAPTFMFTPEDVAGVTTETGLNKEQVQVWADNFRFRYETEKDRMDFLLAEPSDKQVFRHLSSLGSPFQESYLDVS